MEVSPIGPVWSARATCENGHTQTLSLQGYTREQAELFAGLLDGTSSAYLKRPCDEPEGATAIGRCGICGKKFRVEVVEQKTG